MTKKEKMAFKSTKGAVSENVEKEQHHQLDQLKWEGGSSHVMFEV